MSSHALPANAEHLFRYLFEQASLGIAVEDLDGKILVANPALCSMLGYRDHELTGMNCSQFATSEDSQDDWALFERLRVGAIDHYAIEKRYKKKDGAPLWGRLNVSLLNGTNGESPLVFAFVENITEHKLTEEALHQKEKELTETQGRAGIGSWSWDARTDRMMWSKEISLRTGHDPNSPAPKLQEQARLFSPESWDRLQRTVHEALQTGTSYEIDLELVSPLSGVKWATTRGEPLRDADGQIIGLRGTIQDITEHKLAEQELARINGRFRLAMEASKSVGWEWDIKTGQDSWFGDLQTMFGIPSDSFVGRVGDFYRRVHPEDQARVAKAVADARLNRKQYAAEFRVIRLDGTERSVDARGTFHYASTGEPTRMLGMATDITERKRAEEKLRESEERLRLAVEAGNMYAYDWDPVTDTVTRSAEYGNILGLIDPAEHLTRRQLAARVHPEDCARFISSVDHLSPENPTIRISYRMLRPDRSVVWLEKSARALFDAQGKLLRVMGMVTDITERKRAEERLEEYEKAIECSTDSITVIDREYRYLIANRTFLKLRNMTKEQVIGRLVPDVLNKGVFEAVVKDKLDECFAGKIVRYELRYTYPEVGERDLLLSYFPIEGGGSIDRVACIAQDITERKRAQDELRESEQRLRLAVQAGKMYAFDWDVVTDVIVRSKESVNILHWTDPEHDTGRDFHARVHPEDAAIYATTEAGLTPEYPTYQINLRTLGPDGSVMWLEDTGRASFDAQGKMVRVIGMVADITERKRAEQALQESEDKLRLLLDSTAEAIYGIDLEHRCTFCNPSCLRLLGYRHLDEVLGKHMHNLIHHTRADGTSFPVEECRIHRVTQIGEGVHAEDEVLWRSNGTSFPVEYWSYPQRRGEEVIGAVVTFIDITERKLTEAALGNVSRKLIEAQEQERSRIGRELHDDIGQRLALVAVELQQLHKEALVFPRVRSRLGELQKKVSQIAADTQSLSHELHSARLQYLGITGAMRGFCREFGEQQKVKVEFKANELPTALSPDISLCLFRVLQEALHNSAKHSEVRRFEVRLWGTGDEIRLTVKDSGKGFDREAAKTSQGLGLISMEERLKIVNGTLSIESQPRRGTTIEARVPVSSSESLRATG